MYVKIGIFLLLCSCLSGRLQAADSIRMEKRGGQWFVVHAVEAQETLFGLARRYGSTVQAIQSYNKETDTLRIHQQLYIPYHKAISAPADTVAAKSIAAPINESLPAHKAAGETDVQQHAPPAASSRWASDSLFAASYRIHFVSEEGLAMAGQGGAGVYALHRQAPIGTFIRVENSINGQQLLVRVIGRLPEIDAHEKTLVQLSVDAYKLLRSPDARTWVQLTYLQAAE